MIGLAGLIVFVAVAVGLAMYADRDIFSFHSEG